MLSKNKFYVLSAILILVILVGKMQVSNLLERVAVKLSPDDSIKNETLQLIYILFLLTIIVLMVVFYLVWYGNLFRSKDNKIILAFVLFEYFAVLLIYTFKHILLDMGQNNAFAFLNAFQLFIAASIAFLISKKYKKYLREKSLWLIFSFGFIYLAIDELLEIHEHLGDDLLYPIVQYTRLGNFISSNFHDPNDIIIFAYFLLGMLIVFLFRQVFVEYFNKTKKPVIIFLLAVFIMGLQMIFEKYQFYFLEEASEVFSSMFFVLSFYLLYIYLKNNKSNGRRKNKIKGNNHLKLLGILTASILGSPFYLCKMNLEDYRRIYGALEDNE